MLPISDRKLVDEVCRAVLAAAQLGYLWTAEGPVDSIDHVASTLPASQQAVVRFARALWSGDSRVAVGDLLTDAEDDHVVILGTLLVAVAYGRAGIQDWLAVQNERPFPEAPRTSLH